MFRPVAPALLLLGELKTDLPLTQRFVLGEMIKASSIDVVYLVEFIRQHDIEQNWLHMQLPIGE